MQERIRVRRERPSALSWAIALAVTMLAVYLITVFLGQARMDAFPGSLITALLSLIAVPVLYPVFLSIGGSDDTEIFQ